MIARFEPAGAGHCLDVQILRDAPHRQGFEPIPVDDREGGVEDVLAVDPGRTGSPA